MREQMQVSWRLARSSIGLLRANTDLLIFPIIGLLTYSLLIGLAMTGVLYWVDFRVDLLWNAPFWAKLIATYILYLVGYLIVFSANGAMVAVTLLAFDGKHPTFADGWRIAFAARKTFFYYALVAATAGASLSLFTRWTGRLSGYAFSILRRVLIFSALNLAWHVVPVIITPVLVMEQLDPLSAVQRCSNLVLQKWGEGVVRYANLWHIFLIPLITTAIIGTTAIVWVVSTAQELWIMVIAYLVIMVIVMLFIVASALSGIYSAVVYRYACTQPIIAPFEEEMVSKAFHSRPSHALHNLQRWWHEQLFRKPLG